MIKRKKKFVNITTGNININKKLKKIINIDKQSYTNINYELLDILQDINLKLYYELIDLIQKNKHKNKLILCDKIIDQEKLIYNFSKIKL